MKKNEQREPHEAQELLHIYRLAAVRRYRDQHAKVVNKEKVREYRPLESVVEPKILNSTPAYKRLSKEKMNVLLNEAKNLMDRQGVVIQPKKEEYMLHLKNTLTWLSKNPEKEIKYLPAAYLKTITSEEKKKNEPLFAKVKSEIIHEHKIEQNVQKKKLIRVVLFQTVQRLSLVQQLLQ